ncbi:hypothetical protein ASE00_06700 [Sphingomonas sp. Root710]|uniref:TonB-dependent receptor n=1 Tax=Sphingomonas sp. Root710 TaxID=1736594 RepID=UPI0006F39A47|nr:TonB-dependent receptor [Sphingomonas sp. Root710]KRB86393.1 hypothetical protein ASE00_06700 [Sphingomonas sp. Root710]
MYKPVIKVSRALVLSASMLAASSALAQAASAEGEAADGGLAEIVVTANKRAEPLNRVGLTVTAVSANDLQKQGVAGISDLTRVIPSLSFATTNANTPVYSLRGVGYYDDSLGATPAVAVYVDEVAYPVSVLTSQVVLDLERVEVLKGPQGTLFGQSSTGGAINFIAAKPTAKQSYGLDLSYGRFNTIEGSGFVSGPLSDTLGYRIAVRAVHGDDWQRSYTRDDSLGKSRVLAGRASLAWEPSASARFLLTASGHINKSDPQAPQFIFLLNQVPGNYPLLDNIPTAPRSNRAADWSPERRPRGDDKQYAVSLRGDVDVLPTVKLTSITNFAHFTRDQQTDADGIVPLNFSSNTIGKVKSFSQEVRASSTNLDNLRWVVGANYERTSVRERSLLDTRDASFILTTGLWETNGYGTNQKSRSYAAFGNVEFDVTDQLTVKGGIRYSNVRRNANSCTQDTDARHTLSAFFTDLSNTLRAGQGLGAITPLPPFACVSLDNVTQDAQGRILYTPGRFSGVLKEHNFPWRVGVDFKATPDLLLYFNVSKGYKSGAFTTVSAATFSQLAPITQESLLDYEGGFKLQMFNRRLNLTGAAFYYKYNDKQLRSKVIDPVFNLLDSLRNVPKSSIRGAELNVTAAPVRGLTFGTSVTYLDSRIDEFTGFNGFSQLVDFEGTRIPFAPKYSVTSNIDYRWPVTDAFEVNVGGNFTYNSATNSTVGNDAFSRIGAYRTVDVRMGLHNVDRNWSVTLWGKNIFNEYYWTNANAVSDTRVRYAARPATYGISFSIRN